MPGTVITDISVANPSVVSSTSHGLTNGQVVKITGSNSTPTIDGDRVATVINANSFSVPVNVTVGGNTGNAQRVFFMDPESGSDSNNGTTFALRIKTLTTGLPASRIAPGDDIRIIGSPDPTDTGQTATFTRSSKTITLTTAVTADIDLCETAWTASASVTATADATLFKQGAQSSKLAIAAGFTTGVAAYKTLTLTDYSAYKQVSFWIRSTVAIPASSLSIRLCTDTVGAVSANTITVPAIPMTSQWIPIAVDTGGALSALINSVALYVDSDFGATDIFLDNIIACKDSTAADSITMVSLIGKNTGGYEPWLPIQSINGTTILIDGVTNTIGTSGVGSTTDGRGYWGATETVELWKRETTKFGITTTAIGTITDNGTQGNLIYFSGGWNRTDMSTQTLESWLDNQSISSTALGMGSRLFISITKLNLVRCGFGLLTSNGGVGCVFDQLQAVACDVGISIAGGFALSQIGLLKANNCGQIAIRISSVGVTYGEIYAHSSSCGIDFLNAAENRIFKASIFNCEVSGSNSFGAIVVNAGSSGNIVYNLTTDGNDTSPTACVVASKSSSINACGTNSFFNARISEANKYSVGSLNYGKFISLNQSGIANNHLITTLGGTIASETGIRHSAADISWKMSVTSTTRNAINPLDYVVATIPVVSGSTVTPSLWFYRNSPTITGQLVCRSGQLAGINGSSGLFIGTPLTWNPVSITLNPLEDGVVEIEALAYADVNITGSVFIDDFQVYST